MDELGGLIDLLTVVALIGGLGFAAYEWRASRLE
jgi:hypothetical protein